MQLFSRLAMLSTISLFLGCTKAPAEDVRICAPTAADALGPFYVADMPVVDDLNRHGKPGESLTLTGRVLSSIDSQPVPNARIEIWQTDSEGIYHPADNGAYADYADEAIDLRGTVIVGEDGTYRVETLVPGAYFPRPRHLHYRITANDHEVLVTQLYITGDTAGGGDDCRQAGIEQTADGLLYSAPDIFLTPR